MDYRFDGQQLVSRPPAAVSAKFNDPNFRPTDEGVEYVASTEDSVHFRARPAILIFGGAVDVRVTFVERVPSERTRLRYDVSGAGTTAQAAVLLEYEPAENGGTLVRWHAELSQLTGLGRLVPKVVLQTAGQKALEKLWREAARKIEAEVPETPPSDGQ